MGVPAYVFGLYTNLSANSVLTGTSLGVVTCIILISVVFSNEGAHDPFPLVDKSWATFVGVAVNISMSILAHFVIFGNEKDNTTAETDDGDSGKKPLSLDDIRDVMKGITEPMTKYGGALVYLSMAITIIVAFHWIGEIDPELVDEYGSDYAKEIMYNGTVRNVIGGLPDYIFATMMWYLVAIAVGIAATLQWDVKAADNSCPGTPNSRKKPQHVAQESTHQPTESGTMNGVTNGVSDGADKKGAATEMVSAPINGEIE